MVRLRNYEGTTPADEDDLLRWTWWAYLLEVNKALPRSDESVQMAAVYMHRFFQIKTYMFYKETSYDRDRTKVIATAALLTGGVEMRVLLPIFLRLLYKKSSDDQHVHEKEILAAQEELSDTISPSFQVDLPQTLITIATVNQIHPRVDLTETLEAAFRFVFHAYASTICIHYAANQILVGALKMAEEEMGIEFVRNWHRAFGCTASEMKDMYARMCEVIDQLPSSFGVDALPAAPVVVPVAPAARHVPVIAPAAHHVPVVAPAADDVPVVAPAADDVSGAPA